MLAAASDVVIGDSGAFWSSSISPICMLFPAAESFVVGKQARINL